jgi:L-alanine-DL-glutamate epimerase-like enolase superfamily enzyme
MTILFPTESFIILFIDMQSNRNGRRKLSHGEHHRKTRRCFFPTDAFEISDGMITVPELHGLEIEVDRQKIEKRQPSA